MLWFYLSTCTNTTFVCQKCLPKLAPVIMTGLFAACNMDMCLAPSTKMPNLCAISERIETECMLIKEQVPSWRNANGLQCGGKKQDECFQIMYILVNNAYLRLVYLLITVSESLVHE